MAPGFKAQCVRACRPDDVHVQIAVTHVPIPHCLEVRDNFLHEQLHDPETASPVRLLKQPRSIPATIRARILHQGA
jgi:hypothetical protein